MRKKRRAGRIEAFAEIRLILGRQFAFGVHADLIEHASEVDEAADFRGWTPDR